MLPLETFLWGFMGSVAVELITILSFYYSRPLQLPSRYRKTGFWIARFVLALLAGALAVGYDIHHRILAFNIGAATPLIITFMARGLRPGSTASEVLSAVDRRGGSHAHSGGHADQELVGSHRKGPFSHPR